MTGRLPSADLDDLLCNSDGFVRLDAHTTAKLR
jgi:hypothetical protein